MSKKEIFKEINSSILNARIAEVESMIASTSDPVLIKFLQFYIKSMNTASTKTAEQVARQRAASRVIQRRQQDEALSEADRHCNRWTAEEISLLNNLTLKDIEIAKTLQRSVFAVQAKRTKLKRIGVTA
jgi:hypothetical protein